MRKLVNAVMVLAFLLIFTLAQAAEVTVSWDQNPEPDIAGYKLHYSRQSGNYSTIIDVGNTISYEVTGLSDGIYFFAVTAYDLSGQGSEYSTEQAVYVSEYTIYHYSVDPSTVDSDGDDLNDLYEANTLGTDPLDPDTDDDGYWDDVDSDPLNSVKHPRLHIELEAENAEVMDGPVVVFSDSNASGGKYAGTPADASGGGIEVEFDVLGHVTANVWARVRAESGGQDTYWWSMNSGSYTRWDAPIATGWRWQKITTYDFSSGPNSLRINFAEKSMGLDKIFITEDLDFVPSDDWPFTVEVEAEDADIIDGSVTVLTDSDASGGQYAGTPVDAYGGGIEVYFTILGDKTCNVWARVRAESGGQDTYWWSMNNGSYTRWDAPIATGWRWQKITTYDFSSGPNSLRINFAEKSMGLDKILITEDLDFVPDASPEAFTYSVEAELADVMDGSVTTLADSEASGGYYAGTPVDASGGGIEVHFNLSGSKTCNVWARVRAESGGQDTYWWSVNGGSYTRWDAPIEIGWQWRLITTYDFPSGDNIFRINFAEKNMGMDQIIITDDLDFIPE